MTSLGIQRHRGRPEATRRRGRDLEIDVLKEITRKRPRTIANEPKGRGHQAGIDTMMALRLDNQHQRGNMPRAIVRFWNRDGFDVHHERRGTGRVPRTIFGGSLPVHGAISWIDTAGGTGSRPRHTLRPLSKVSFPQRDYRPTIPPNAGLLYL